MKEQFSTGLSGAIRKSSKKTVNIDDVIGEHMVIAKQFKRKAKASVPNCSLILPQRYKKDFEEKILPKLYHSRKRSAEKPWHPGGDSKLLRNQSDLDRSIKRS